MKIFQTQLQGLINQMEDQEEALEDAARMIAQSIISDNEVWIYAEDEMIGVVAQAMHGTDKLPNLSMGEQGSLFDSMDTLLLFSPHKMSQEAMKVVLSAKEAGANIVGVSSESTPQQDGTYHHHGLHSNDVEHDAPIVEESWTESCSLHFSTGIKSGLVPTESIGRIGMPHLLVGLHYYYAIYFSVMEILEEYEFDFDLSD